MKALLFDWAGAGNRTIREMGYKHMQVLEVTSKKDLYVFVDELLENGVDVMIEKRDSGECTYQINVDGRGKRFRQR